MTFFFYYFCRAHRPKTWVTLNALRCPSVTQSGSFLSLGLVEAQSWSETEEVSWQCYEGFYSLKAIWPPLLSKGRAAPRLRAAHMTEAPKGEPCCKMLLPAWLQSLLDVGKVTLVEIRSLKLIPKALGTPSSHSAAPCPAGTSSSPSQTFSSPAASESAGALLRTMLQFINDKHARRSSMQA